MKTPQTISICCKCRNKNEWLEKRWKGKCMASYIPSSISCHRPARILDGSHGEDLTRPQREERRFRRTAGRLEMETTGSFRLTSPVRSLTTEITATNSTATDISWVSYPTGYARPHRDVFCDEMRQWTRTILSDAPDHRSRAVYILDEERFTCQPRLICRILEPQVAEVSCEWCKN